MKTDTSFLGNGFKYSTVFNLSLSVLRTSILIVITTLFLASCSLPDTTKQITVDDLVRFGNNEVTRHKFSRTTDSAFSVIEIANTSPVIESKGITDLGWCSDDRIRFKFNVQINNPSPLNQTIWWSIVTEDGILYQDSDYVKSAQPNSISLLELEGLPNIACSSFRPIVLAVRMEDNSYYSEYFYKIKSNNVKLSDYYNFTEEDQVSDYTFTQYKLAESYPYRVEGGDFFSQFLNRGIQTY